LSPAPQGAFFMPSSRPRSTVEAAPERPQQTPRKPPHSASWNALPGGEEARQDARTAAGKAPQRAAYSAPGQLPTVPPRSAPRRPQCAPWTRGTFPGQLAGRRPQTATGRPHKPADSARPVTQDARPQTATERPHGAPGIIPIHGPGARSPAGRPHPRRKLERFPGAGWTHPHPRTGRAPNPGKPISCKGLYFRKRQPRRARSPAPDPERPGAKP
jgi:hypothetical protein